MHLLNPYTTEEGKVAADGEKLWTRATVPNVDPVFLPEQPDPDSDFCPLPILHHEPWNTWESWHVWNVTSHLLQAGSGFCARPGSERTTLFNGWRAKLDDVMARHRSNNAFIVCNTSSRIQIYAIETVSRLADNANWCPPLTSHVVPGLTPAPTHDVDWKTYELPCRLTKMAAAIKIHGERPLDAAFERRVQADMKAEIDDEQRYEENELRSWLERLRNEGDCDLAGVTAPDLVSAFGNDTEITLAMAKGLVWALQLLNHLHCTVHRP